MVYSIKALKQVTANWECPCEFSEMTALLNVCFVWHRNTPLIRTAIILFPENCFRWNNMKDEHEEPSERYFGVLKLQFSTSLTMFELKMATKL